MIFYLVLVVVSLAGIVGIVFFRLRVKGSAGFYANKTRASNPSAICEDESLQPEQTDFWQHKTVAEICSLAEAELAAKQSEKALEYLDFLFSLDHQKEVEEYLYSLRVAAHELAGDLNSALSYCRKLLELAPCDQACLLKAAELNFALGSFPEAEEFVRKSLDLNKRDLKSLDLLAKIYLQTFRLKEAEQVKKSMIGLRIHRKT